MREVVQDVDGTLARKIFKSQSTKVVHAKDRTDVLCDLQIIGQLKYLHKRIDFSIRNSYPLHMPNQFALCHGYRTDAYGRTTT